MGQTGITSATTQSGITNYSSGSRQDDSISKTDCDNTPDCIGFTSCGNNPNFALHNTADPVTVNYNNSCTTYLKPTAAQATQAATQYPQQTATQSAAQPAVTGFTAVTPLPAITANTVKPTCTIM